MSTPQTLAASALRTANGNGSSLDCDNIGTLRLDLAISGNGPTGEALADGDPRRSPMLEVRIETSSDNTNWRTHATFKLGSSIRTERLCTSGFDRYVRCAWSLRPFNAGAQDPPVGCTFSVIGVSL